MFCEFILFIYGTKKALLASVFVCIPNWTIRHQSKFCMGWVPCVCSRHQVIKCLRPFSSRNVVTFTHTLVLARRTYKQTRTRRAALLCYISQCWSSLASFCLMSISVAAGDTNSVFICCSPCLSRATGSLRKKICARIRANACMWRHRVPPGVSVEI